MENVINAPAEMVRGAILHRPLNRNGGGNASCRLCKLLNIAVCEEVS
jgi:hypothetical protein